MQPGRERGIPAELRKPRERADKCVLRELPGLLRIPAQPISERVHPGRVRVVQRTPGQPISRDDPGDELCLVHAVVYLPLISVATIFCKVRHGEWHKRSVRVGTATEQAGGASGIDASLLVHYARTSLAGSRYRQLLVP